MTRRTWLFVVCLPFLSLLTPLTGHAQEVSGQNAETPIGIEVKQSPIHLTTVQAPTFGSYELTGQGQQLQATGDLIIQVEDTRTTDLSAWGLQYELSIFNTASDDNTLGEQTKLNLGTGELTMNGQAVDASRYSAQSVELSPDTTGTLMQTNFSQPTTFSYRVPKEKISLSISGLRATGEYSATQTVTLSNLTIVE